MRSLKRCLAIVAAVVTTAAAGIVAASPATADQGSIPITITNKSGRNDPVYIYILGTKLGGANDGQDGWADADGTFHKWPNAGSTPVDAPDASIPGPANGQSETIQLPRFSGRVYFSYGQKLHFKVVQDGRLVQPAMENPTDPNHDVLFSWTEYTLNDDGLWINSTQVDFFSAPYQTGLKKADGTVISTGQLKTDGYQHVIDALAATPGWNNLAQTAPDGSVLRILAPGHAIGTGQLSATAMDDYTDRVWNKYTSQDFVVRPFTENPSIVYYGRVSGNTMSFRDGSGNVVASFNKPSSASVFGCANDLQAPNDDVVGPIARTLCASLIRTTALTNPNAPALDPSTYYQDSVTDYYAKYIHEQMVNGKAYGFAFDDVANQESLVHDGNPQQAYIQLDPFSGSTTPIGDNGNGGGGGDGGGGGTGGALPSGTGTINERGGLCVDVPWADATNGNQVQLATCSGNAAQTWTRSGSALQALGKCLDVSSSGTANGTKVQLWTCNQTNAQEWTYDPVTQELVNPHSGKCLDATGGTPVHDGQLLQIWDCTGADNQTFSFDGWAPTGPVTGLASKCIDLSNGSTTTANGTPVQLWNCNGTIAQTWTFRPDGTIRNQGKCLDVTSNSTANGAKLQLWDCNGTGAQKFTVSGQLITSQETGKCIDVTDNNSANGARLQMWDCYSSANQLWNVPS